ncbi:hypothetical protein HPB52_021990 [Rhipicephalus sanguineus]|uniref:Down syndrome cell adhesion molecule n=1 Tax=Rhipicephalus sanguineus TaxID=34632 RepID=A0A9D4T380_RHISA|nr:hypothetical protein HPB52_021990 [Rhipicephalus sanguineus]
MSPTLEETFGSVTVKRGDAVSLRCRARGSPTPEISWAIDGDFLYPSQRLRITAERSPSDVESVLNISDARLEDSGEYSCVARNDIATDAHSARVDVEGEPFVRPLRNVTVVSGTLLTLRCPYGGYPIESLTWRKECSHAKQMGYKLSISWQVARTKDVLCKKQSVDNRGRLLVQQALKFADEGEYTCAITGHSQLVASGSTYVSVVVAPTIDEHFFPDVVKVEEGSRSRLMCSVSKGDPPLRFRWLKNGLRISSHGERVIETTDDSSIIKIGRVRFADHGEYTCFVSNDAASVNRSVELVVHGSYPRNFSYIHYNFRNHQFNNGSLLIREVEEADGGFYLCEADNGIGAGISRLAHLKVKVPPKFKEKHRRLSVKKGENLQVHCQAVGDPPTTYFWEKNQKPIDTERYHIKTVEGSGGKSYSLLDMQEPTRDESGVYSCKAKNDHGEDTSHIQVIVQEPPDAPVGVQVTNCTSRSATVQWQTPYNGNSPITRYMLHYKLLKDPWNGPVSVLVILGSDTQSTVRELQPVTEYAIRVSAENALGPGEHSGQVVVTTLEEGKCVQMPFLLNINNAPSPSGAPLSLTVHTTGSQSLKVSWKAPKKEQQHGTILGYRVGYRVAHTDDSFQFKQVEVRRVPGYGGVPSGRNEEKDGREGEHEYSKFTYRRIFEKKKKARQIVTALFGALLDGPISFVPITTFAAPPPTSPSIKALPLSNSSLLVQWEREKKDDYSATAPISPASDKFVVTNGTSAALNLAAWMTAGCPVTSFAVQYRPRFHKAWILAADAISPGRRHYVIGDLAPGRQYQVRVVAQSDAGATQADFPFRTAALPDSVSTQSPTAIKDQSAVPFHLNASMVAPLAVCAILMPIAVLLVHIYFKRHRSRRSRAIEHESPDPSKQYFQDAVILSVFNQKEPAMKNSVASSTYYASMSNKTLPLAIKNHRPVMQWLRLYVEPRVPVLYTGSASTTPCILSIVPSIKGHYCQTQFQSTKYELFWCYLGRIN